MTDSAPMSCPACETLAGAAAHHVAVGGDLVARLDAQIAETNAMLQRPFALFEEMGIAAEAEAVRAAVDERLGEAG